MQRVKNKNKNQATDALLQCIKIFSNIKYRFNAKEYVSTLPVLWL